MCSVCGTSAKIGGWDTAPNTQYHIQTDEGPERYFKYQTVSGQYRKEKRLQDGTVVGSYGWVDANGILRLKDYIADDKGYRIVRTKLVNVGNAPIDDAVSAAKNTPSNSAVETAAYEKPAPVSIDMYQAEKQKTAPISYDDYIKQKIGSTPKPISLSDYLREKHMAATTSPAEYTPNVEVNINGYPSTTAAPATTAQYSTTSTPEYVRPITFRPYFNFNSLTPDKKAYQNRYVASGSEHVPKYDGVSLTRNGFRYYLPRHYHEETTLPGQQRAGSFGYIDPFGIRRVIYYNASPGSGFIHRKNNRYVGFQATPYDPRFKRSSRSRNF